MDFFQSQESARHKTALLVFLFLLAVVCIIWGVYLAVVVAWRLFGDGMGGWWQPRLFYPVAGGVIAVVLLGSLYKIIDLAKGGRRVAELLGGTPIDHNTVDLEQRKLLNVVEEMAIASGIPVPQAYILKNERSINAFAAGLTTDDAVVAVTKGCLDTLSRDELQGVIGHEFSHILNGDMRLNLRLMGVINGILIIAIVGRVILRGSRGPYAAMALMLVALGYIGVLFGKLLKVAISRQREFLADAAAIQFTRNPGGIFGALKKIARGARGSRIASPRAEEASHFFFCNGLSKSFKGLLSTHPPIQERMRRIQVDYDGLLDTTIPMVTPTEQMAIDQGIVSFMAEPTSQPHAAKVPLQPQQFLSLIGTIQPAQLDYARTLVAAVPPPVSEAARELLGAVALIYCLLLHKEGEARRKQLKRLETHTQPELLQEIKRLSPLMTSLDRRFRLPILDITLPTLKKISFNQYRLFRENVRHLIVADEQVNLFEYVVLHMLIGRLDSSFKADKPKKVRYYQTDQVNVECFDLLSILAWQGSRDAATARSVFKKAMQVIDAGTTTTILPKEKSSFQLLVQALKTLSEGFLQLKKTVLEACLVCMSADNVITVDEAELFRAIGNTLDCPVPPLVPGSIAANKDNIVGRS
ncbi:MAG: M48 family metallopeptidase [Deltaproteobacteria bacterium]|nr:M48 family metallopeptidase [Deltaproteobacteria bacterium]